MRTRTSSRPTPFRTAVGRCCPKRNPTSLTIFACLRFRVVLGLFAFRAFPSARPGRPISSSCTAWTGVAPAPAEQRRSSLLVPSQPARWASSGVRKRHRLRGFRSEILPVDNSGTTAGLVISAWAGVWLKSGKGRLEVRLGWVRGLENVPDGM